MQKPPIPESSKRQALLQRRWVRLLILLILIVAVGILAIPRFMRQTPAVQSTLPSAEHGANTPSPLPQMKQSPTTQTVVLPQEQNTVLATSGLPRPDHVVIVIEENHTSSSIIGSTSAPYINALAQSGAMLWNHSAGRLLASAEYR